MGTSKLLGYNLTKCWKVTCDGLVSHPGSSRNNPSHFILRKLEMSASTDGPSARPISIGADFYHLYLTFMNSSIRPKYFFFQLATEYGIKFMETSAKASINVEQVSF